MYLLLYQFGMLGGRGRGGTGQEVSSGRSFGAVVARNEHCNCLIGRSCVCLDAMLLPCSCAGGLVLGEGSVRRSELGGDLEQLRWSSAAVRAEGSRS